MKNKFTHQEQQAIWDKEHQHPHVLLQMDVQDASSGVIRFYDWLTESGLADNKLSGVEMGCGKGRNSIWLAQQGIDMTAFDFSPAAITEAHKRAQRAKIKVDFCTQDATEKWPFASNTFDFGIDCFASTDIESPEGRLFAKNEMVRVLKKDGYLLVYTLSTDDEFHQEMMNISPAEEPNAFYHPSTGKFEKTFDRDELRSLYRGLRLVEEKRVEKTTEFFGKQYACKHYWMVFKKG